MSLSQKRVAVIGAGLAGSEATLVLAAQGVLVDLFEMRPKKMTPAHETGDPAELVCSNSLKSMRTVSAHGLLKEELSILGSPLIAAAKETAVPAGSALAVDRAAFSARIVQAFESFPNVKLIRQEITEPPIGYDAVLIAAGPLVSDPLAVWIQTTFPSAPLHFYDAIAPIISFDSINMDIAFVASRNDDGDGDYINCPFTEEEYFAFYRALREADTTQARSFEDAHFFEGCLPIEVMAERGELTLSYGCMRPIGITNPRTGRSEYRGT